jgi:hypothetical protein
MVTTHDSSGVGNDWIVFIEMVAHWHWRQASTRTQIKARCGEAEDKGNTAVVAW